MPPTALTPPDAIRKALAEYVSFEGSLAGVTPLQPAAASEAPPPPPPGLPRKGMLISEADAHLGAPEKTSERSEGQLKVVTRVYASASGRITAEFVEGVLFRYTATSD